MNRVDPACRQELERLPTIPASLKLSLDQVRVGYKLDLVFEAGASRPDQTRLIIGVTRAACGQGLHDSDSPLMGQLEYVELTLEHEEQLIRLGLCDISARECSVIGSCLYRPHIELGFGLLGFNYLVATRHVRIDLTTDARSTVRLIPSDRLASWRVYDPASQREIARSV